MESPFLPGFTCTQLNNGETSGAFSTATRMNTRMALSSKSASLPPFESG